MRNFHECQPTDCTYQVDDITQEAIYVSTHAYRRSGDFCGHCNLGIQKRPSRDSRYYRAVNGHVGVDDACDVWRALARGEVSHAKLVRKMKLT